VYLTRDGGASWQNVTPAGLEETLINSIEVSPHTPGKAIIATTRYKFNDFSPAVFITNDYGKTWKKIGNGFEKEDFCRVVREDPVRKGLLYAGNERGFYISTNDGDVALNWALDSHGILMRAEWDVAKYLRTGRLEPVLADYETPAADVYAVYLERLNLSAKVSYFIEYLRDYLSRHADGPDQRALRW